MEVAPGSMMQSVLELARHSLFLSNPNPRVGCVIRNAGGVLVGQGHTQQTGGPHAEVMALRDALQRGQSTLGATAYVSLEPCSHHGRTPPCCDALIAAGVSRVVVATTDPNPLVAGRGLERLRAAGIEVELLSPQSQEARDARELNIGFFSRMIRGTPWVRIKSAASLDGVTALGNGVSQWITGEAARADGHAWRARACAVLTGIGTVLSDDPMLDVRSVDTPRQPHLVIVDSQLRTPPSARLFQAPAQGHSRRILIYTAHAPVERRLALEAAGATLIDMPGSDGRVDLAAMMRDLASSQSVNELHVEGGHRLHAALIQQGLMDELLLYQAPRLLGSGGLGVTSWGPLQSLDQGLALRFVSVEPVADDLRVLARVQGRDAFLHA